ncbi:MAG: hypothetical protein ACYDED_15160, partial [Ferrimicrobium sp.]
QEDGTKIATPERRSAPVETLVLLRAMMKHVRRHRISVPQLWRSRTMMLDGTVAQVKQSAGVAHDLWVRVSTLDARHPAWIPLGANRFFNDASGELSNFAQITVSSSPFHQTRYMLCHPEIELVPTENNRCSIELLDAFEYSFL